MWWSQFSHKLLGLSPDTMVQSAVWDETRHILQQRRIMGSVTWLPIFGYEAFGSAFLRYHDRLNVGTKSLLRCGEHAEYFQLLLNVILYIVTENSGLAAKSQLITLNNAPNPVAIHSKYI